MDTAAARGSYISDSCVDGDHQLAIPFVQNQLIGRALAYFSMHDIVLEVGAKRQDEFRKDIQIAFDTLSRQVVYVRCFGETGHPEFLYRWPEKAEAEEQLEQMRESYISIPHVTPIVNVLEALRKCKFYPVSSQDCRMYYVLFSGQGAPAIPVWIIDLRGLPPWGGSRRVDASLTFQHNVVDAMSGNLLGSSNLPAPALEPDSLDPLRW